MKKTPLNWPFHPEYWKYHKKPSFDLDAATAAAQKTESGIIVYKWVKCTTTGSRALVKLLIPQSEKVTFINYGGCLAGKASAVEVLEFLTPGVTRARSFLKKKDIETVFEVGKRVEADNKERGGIYFYVQKSDAMESSYGKSYKPVTTQRLDRIEGALKIIAAKIGVDIL